jgi:hypothetical protein
VRYSDGFELTLPWRKIDQDARGTKLSCRSVAPTSVRSKTGRLDHGRGVHRGPALPPDLAPAFTVQSAKGVRSKLAPARYPGGYADSIALIVQRWTGRAGFDGGADKIRDACRIASFSLNPRGSDAGLC